jgi:hypothetical protein
MGTLSLIQGTVGARVAAWQQMALAESYMPDIDRARGGTVADEEENDEYERMINTAVLGLHGGVAVDEGESDSDGDKADENDASPSPAATQPLYTGAKLTKEEADYGFGRIAVKYQLMDGALQAILKWVKYMLPEDNIMSKCVPTLSITVGHCR